MTDIKSKYPTANADSVAVTITMAPAGVGLASSSGLTVGRASAVIDNTSNLDIDHLISGAFKTGGSAGTANTSIELWAVVPAKTASGTATWPDTFAGSDASVTITTRGVLYGHARCIGVLNLDATNANRTYHFGGFSVAGAFAGVMPPRYQLFVVHNFGTALSATEADQYIHYTRIQSQSA